MAIIEKNVPKKISEEQKNGDFSDLLITNYFVEDVKRYLKPTLSVISGMIMTEMLKEIMKDG